MRLQLLVLSLPVLACEPSGFQGLNPTAADTLVGTLERDGQPVSGAPVHLVVNGASVASVRSAADGRFRFEPLAQTGRVTVVAHDERGHAAMIELELYAGGRNDSGTLSLAPLARLPMLVGHRGLGLDERLTDLPGDVLRSDDTRASFIASPQLLNKKLDRIPLLVVSPSDPQSQRLLELSLHDGEVRTVFDVLPGNLLWYDETHYAGAVQSSANDEYILGLFELETHREVARVSTWRSKPAHVDSARYVWFEELSVSSSISVHRPVVVSREGGITRGPVLDHVPKDFSAMTSDDRALYYLGHDQGEPEDWSGETLMWYVGPRVTLYRLDLTTLESRPLGPMLNPTRDWLLQLHHDRALQTAYFIRTVGPEACAVTEIRLDTGARTDLHVLFHRGEGCWRIVTRQVGSALILEAHRARDEPLEYFAIDFARGASLTSLAVVSGGERWRDRGQNPDAGTHTLLVFEAGAREAGGPVRWARVSPAARVWTELDTVVDLDGRRFDICDPDCGGYLLADGTAVFTRRDDSGGFEVPSLSYDGLEISLDGERRFRRFRLRHVDKVYGLPIQQFDSIDVNHLGLDVFDKQQLFVAPRGATQEAFKQASFFPTTGADLLQPSIDERWLYYLARDPISGRNQLFRSSTERSFDGGAQ